MGLLREPFEVSEGFNSLVLFLEGLAHHLGDAHDDTGGIEVVVQGLALTQELGRKEQVELLHALVSVFHVEVAGVAHGDGALNDHHCVGVHLQHRVDDGLHGTGVEEVLLGIVVGGSGDDDKLGVLITSFLVKGCFEV